MNLHWSRIDQGIICDNVCMFIHVFLLLPKRTERWGCVGRVTKVLQEEGTSSHQPKWVLKLSGWSQDRHEGLHDIPTISLYLWSRYSPCTIHPALGVCQFLLIAPWIMMLNFNFDSISPTYEFRNFKSLMRLSIE